MNKTIVIVTTIILLIFIFLIGLDVFPFLRGPAPYPPDWQWPYQFKNTLNKIWLPFLIIFGILAAGWYLENKTEKKIEKKQWAILVGLILLSFIFQFSILFFSRSGIFVLLHRIINPYLNGYFTTSLPITNIAYFLQTYNQKVLSFYMHATGHMPGSILFFWVINKVVYYLPFLNNLSSNFSPSHTDVRLIWNSLQPYEKTGAVLSAFFIPLLSSLSLAPLYFIAKHLYGIRTAIRASFLYMVIPSLVLFIPISDVFFPIFFLVSFFYFLKKNYFLSGVIFSLGLFFSLSLLPLLFIFILIDRKNVIQFLTGLVTLPVFLFLFFQFNMIEVSRTLMKGLPVNRSYPVWVFYNLYDFFIFSGIPILVLFIIALIKRTEDILFWAFAFMILALNFSGSVRGETGRIWIPFVGPLILVVANFLTNKLKFSKNIFLYLVFLQAIQILTMQEFWVTLW